MEPEFGVTFEKVIVIDEPSLSINAEATGSEFTKLIDSILSTFKFIEPVAQCTQDSDCKLLYSSCDCEAVPVSDSRTYLEVDEICKRNECTAPTEKKAVCLNNRCQISNK